MNTLRRLCEPCAKLGRRVPAAHTVPTTAGNVYKCAKCYITGLTPPPDGPARARVIIRPGAARVHTSGPVSPLEAYARARAAISTAHSCFDELLIVDNRAMVLQNVLRALRDAESAVTALIESERVA